MSTFSFTGALPASKSILNRLLILRSFKPELEIIGDSTCDDVRAMKLGLQNLGQGAPIDCASAGTTLRFLALRAARLPGEHLLIGSRELFSRPQKPLFDLLTQLGCRVRQDNNSLYITTTGWQKPNGPLLVDVSQSSQFLSAVLLSAWDLPFDLEIELQGKAVSSGYEQMTEETVTAAGMQLERTATRIGVVRAQKIRAVNLAAEADLSSAFAVSALAAIAGEARIQNFPNVSLQPDFVFVSLLKEMGAEVALGQGLTVKQASRLRPVSCDLRNAPDLFPVLSVLCAFAEGTSILKEAPQLKYKESDRIKKSAELIRLLGRDCEETADGMRIYGRSMPVQSDQVLKYSAENDHRLAMAAAVALWAGYAIDSRNRHVVSKSFPEFWRIAGLQ